MRDEKKKGGGGKMQLRNRQVRPNYNFDEDDSSLDEYLWSTMSFESLNKMASKADGRSQPSSSQTHAPPIICIDTSSSDESSSANGQSPSRDEKSPQPGCSKDNASSASDSDVICIDTSSSDESSSDNGQSPSRDEKSPQPGCSKDNASPASHSDVIYIEGPSSDESSSDNSRSPSPDENSPQPACSRDHASPMSAPAAICISSSIADKSPSVNGTSPSPDEKSPKPGCSKDHASPASDPETEPISRTSVDDLPSTRGPSPDQEETTKSTVQRKRKKKRGRPKAAAVPSAGEVDPNLPFVKRCMLKDGHKKPLYGLAFNLNLREGEPMIFATAGGNRATIYECLEDGSIKLLQCYADGDPKEMYYTCAWSSDKSRKYPILAVAGAKGSIRLISPADGSCRDLPGHPNEIYYLMFHPTDKNLLFSASRDHSIRLWNLRTGICVAIFGVVNLDLPMGEDIIKEGHRDEVISIDIDSTGSRMISGGMDHGLIIWNLAQPRIKTAIRLSYRFTPDSFPSYRTPRIVQEYYTTEIHSNYIDCVKWFGELIFSKSCENDLICWKPEPGACAEEMEIAKLPLKSCDVWYIRFGLNSRTSTMALGNNIGEIYVYDLNVDDPSKIKPIVLRHQDCNSVIRQVAFSRDGKILICVCEDSTIWRWDRKVSQEKASQEVEMMEVEAEKAED